MTKKMKPSEIAWIGDIPESWDIGRVKDYYALQTGFTPDTSVSEYYDDENGYLWVSIADINADKIINDTKSKISSLYVREKHPASSPAGSLLYSFKLSVGKVAFLGKEMFTNEAIASFANSPDVCLAFLYYSSMFIEENANRNIYGAKILNQDLIKNAHIVFPPLMEQRAIAEFLDTQCAKIDSVIADIEKQIEILQKYKKSLITEAVTKGLDASVEMKESGVKWVGEIPVDWKVSRVKYLIDDNHPYPIGDGDHGMIKADDYLDEGIPYIRVLNLTWGDGMNLDNLVFISDKMNAMIKNSELRPNDILVAKTGATIGKTAIVPESLPVSNTTSHVGKITLPDTHCAKYFFYVMTSNIVQKQIQDISAMQSTRPELGIDGMRDLVVVVPPLATQERIAEYLDEHCTKTDEILQTKKAQLEIVKKHKSSIIYEYVTGKKRVTEVN